LNLRKHTAIAFAMLMGLLLSEGSLHAVFHEGHHAEEHHNTCDGHHHETDPGADSICSHEHQCELCVLFQTNSSFLLKAKSPNFARVNVDGHFQKIENTLYIEPIEVSSPRAPPVA
jgi:ABC-type Zn2+ transport system substrate-binding protein/surface adhesin